MKNILLQFQEQHSPWKTATLICLERILSVICPEVPVLFPSNFLKYCSCLINLQHPKNLTFPLGNIYTIKSLYDNRNGNA